MRRSDARGRMETPGPKAGEVLVAFAAAGICAGDMYIYRAKTPTRFIRALPGTRCGIVEAVGEGVTNIRRGDRVVVEPFIGCGKCYPCRVGKSNCCANLGFIGIESARRVRRVCGRAREKYPSGPGRAFAAGRLVRGAGRHRRPGCRRGECSRGVRARPRLRADRPRADRSGEGARRQVVATDVPESRLKFARRSAPRHRADELLENCSEANQRRRRSRGDRSDRKSEGNGTTVELVASGGRIVIVGLVKKGVDVLSRAGLHAQGNDVARLPRVGELLSRSARAARGW